MNDVPADVRKSVDEIMKEVITKGWDWSTEQCMARAILAERERCIAVVEKDRRSQMAKECNYVPNFVNIQAAISAEIRNSK